jgi:hypothetical protein
MDDTSHMVAALFKNQINVKLPDLGLAMISAVNDDDVPANPN